MIRGHVKMQRDYVKNIHTVISIKAVPSQNPHSLALHVEWGRCGSGRRGGPGLAHEDLAACKSAGKHFDSGPSSVFVADGREPWGTAPVVYTQVGLKGLKHASPGQSPPGAPGRRDVALGMPGEKSKP